jgi:hypothetical protein
MKYNIIKTDNYLLIGSDDEIRRGLFYCVRTKNIFQDEGEDIHCCMGDIRIIAHLPLNNSPVLQGVDLLPPLEDDVEKLAEEFKSSYKKVGVTDYEVSSFIVGYNKAKEKYKYTEEQLKTAIHKAIIFSEENRKITSGEYAVKFYKFYGELIQSPQQPKMPVAFECEMVTMNKGYTEESDYPYQQCDIPKITTNSQGFTQWVGRYIY